MIPKRKHPDLVLGVDISTGGVKVMLMAVAPDGALAPPASLEDCVVQAEHEACGLSGRDPASWLATFRICLNTLSARFPDEVARVRAAGLSTIFPGLYPLPKDGDLDLSLVRLYNDQDSTEVITQHAGAFAELERENRNVVYPGTMVANLLLLRESGRLPDDIAYLAPPNTAFIWQLYREAGEGPRELVSDFSQLVIGGVLEPRRFERCRALGRLFGSDDLPFAEPRPSWHNVLTGGGDALARLRNALGLPMIESLAIGAGDSACGALALGAVLSDGGSRLVNIRGTSDTPIVIARRPYAARGRRFQECLFHYPSPVTADARTAEWYASASILRSGAAWHWTKSICGLDHDELEEAAKQSLISLAPWERPVFVPFLGGERAPTWNPDARGIIFGLTAGTTPGDLALATLEGVAFTLRADLELMAARYPKEMRSATTMLMAGKPARSSLWNWITEQVTGYRVESPRFAEASVLGAALIAWASLQPERDRRRRLIRASLASRELLLADRTPDLREEFAGVADDYGFTAERRYAEFREIYRRLSLREPSRARASEVEFAGRQFKDGPLRI